MQAFGAQLDTWADPEDSVYEQPNNMTGGEIGPSPYPQPYQPQAGRADRLAANVPGDYTSMGGNTNGMRGGGGAEV